MNGTLLQLFHWYTEGNGFLWQHIKEQAKYWSSLGITAVWLPPAYKAHSGKNSVGYDSYDLYDLGEFDQKGTIPTKYGDKKTYLEALEILRENNIEIIVDIVLNHKAGGDELEKFSVVKVEEENRNHVVSEPFEIESYTKFTFPGRGNTYSEFKWHFDCFSGVDYAENQEKSIFKIINEYGDNWDALIGSEKGNYDYLMFNDIEHRNPYVREELKKWSEWYLDQTNFNGVRLDAIKHISIDFFKDWLYNLRNYAQKDIFAVGEYWAPHDLNIMKEYYDLSEGCMHLFDAPLQDHFHIASKDDNFDLRKIFEDTFVSIQPDSAVTLVANHDTQPLQALEATVEPWFKPLAYALILLRKEGYPCVFYPDLYGANYEENGHDGHAVRIDMPKIDLLEKLLHLRQNHAYGEQIDYFQSETCIGWIRNGDENHKNGCIVIMSTADSDAIEMQLGSDKANKTYEDYTQNIKDSIVTNADGKATFSCLPGNISIWIEKI